MNEVNQLQEPLSEIEKAALIQAAQMSLNSQGLMLLRRALFQIDRLKEKSCVDAELLRIDLAATIDLAVSRETKELVDEIMAYFFRHKAEIRFYERHNSLD